MKINLCKFGLHNYKSKKIEIAKGVTDFFGNIILREINECNCGKIKIIPLNLLAYKDCFDETLNWR